jgi:hypothetical protein
MLKPSIELTQGVFGILGYFLCCMGVLPWSIRDKVLLERDVKRIMLH